MSDRARRAARLLLLCSAVPCLVSVGESLADGSLPPLVFADGSGLPAGSGDTITGEALYAVQCAGCHGANGEGASALELVGDHATLAGDWPDNGIAARWPWAPPLFDYVRRAMPPDAPGSLDASATYAIVARLLELNGLVAAGAVIDAATLSALVLPNVDGFDDIDVPAGTAVSD